MNGNNTLSESKTTMQSKPKMELSLVGDAEFIDNADNFTRITWVRSDRPTAIHTYDKKTGIPASKGQKGHVLVKAYIGKRKVCSCTFSFPAILVDKNRFPDMFVFDDEKRHTFTIKIQNRVFSDFKSAEVYIKNQIRPAEKKAYLDRLCKERDAIDRKWNSPKEPIENQPIVAQNENTTPTLSENKPKETQPDKKTGNNLDLPLQKRTGNIKKEMNGKNLHIPKTPSKVFYNEITNIVNESNIIATKQCTIVVNFCDKPYISGKCIIRVSGYFYYGTLHYEKVMSTERITEEDAYRLLKDSVYEQPIVSKILVENRKYRVVFKSGKYTYESIFNKASDAFKELTKRNRYIINDSDLLLLKNEIKAEETQKAIEAKKNALLPAIPFKFYRKAKINTLFIENADQFDSITWHYGDQDPSTYSNTEGVNYSAFVSGSILFFGKKQGHEPSIKKLSIHSEKANQNAGKNESKKQIPETDDLREFRHKYNGFLQPTSLHPKDIYVGLDFGTSFTKVAYYLDNNNKGIISFGESFFKPSVVYFNRKKELSLFRVNPDDRQIRFFKATMIADKKAYSELRYDDLGVDDYENYELLCSVFFLGNIIRYIRHYLNEKYNCVSNLFISMGIPMSKSDKDVEVYNKAFHAAIALSDLPRDIFTFSLSELNEFYNKKISTFSINDYNPQAEGFINCTMPELFTEALYMVQRRDFDEGLYLIIDIGGGTADYALIKKEAANARSMQFRYYCPSAVVAHLGNEVREACQDTEAETVYINQFARMYLSTIGIAKNEDDSIRAPFEVTQILFGGGAALANNYYQTLCSPNHKCQSSIRQIGCSMKTKDQNKYKNPFLSEADNQRISPSDRQRLIIACQLANPESRFAFLSGFPKDYSSIKTSTNKDTKTYFEIVREALGYEPSWF